MLASASASAAEQLVDEGLATDAVPFVTNSLRIVVPAGNPAGVTGLEDLAEEDLLVGLCAEEVPCGQFGREALDRAGVIPSIDTNEPSGVVYASLTTSGRRSASAATTRRASSGVATVRVGRPIWVP